MSRIEKLQAMLDREPNDAFLNFGLAMEYAKSGQTDAALAAFERVLEVDPNYSAAHFHRGNTLIAMGRMDEARKTLEEGIVITKRNSDAHATKEMQELLASIG